VQKQNVVLLGLAMAIASVLLMHACMHHAALDLWSRATFLDCGCCNPQKGMTLISALHDITNSELSNDTTTGQLELMGLCLLLQSVWLTVQFSWQ